MPKEKNEMMETTQKIILPLSGDSETDQELIDNFLSHSDEEYRQMGEEIEEAEIRWEDENKKNEKLAQILAYGERIKARGEEKKREWWKKNSKRMFENLLRYKWNNEEIIEKNYEYLGKLDKIEREKFIEKYLYNDMLYSGKIDEPIMREKYYYKDWKEGGVVVEVGTDLSFYHDFIGDEGVKVIAKNIKLKEFVVLNLGDNKIGEEGAKAIAENMELKEGVGLKLSYNHIGAEGAEAISKMELKEGVTLDLSVNEIGVEGAEAISKMELKEGVTLDLNVNEIGAEGAEAISKMELKEGVELDLIGNEIGDEGAKAIMEKMELKQGVILDLGRNNISGLMKEKLKEWEQSYNTKGVRCEVKL